MNGEKQEGLDGVLGFSAQVATRDSIVCHQIKNLLKVYDLILNTFTLSYNKVCYYFLYPNLDLKMVLELLMSMTSLLLL